MKQKRKYPNWLRWVLVLPASVGGYCFCQVVITLVSGSSDFFSSNNSENYKMLVGGLLSPMCFVFCGAETAPTHKFVTALSLAFLNAMATAALLTYIIVSNQPPIFHWQLVWPALCALAGVPSTIYVCIAFHKWGLSDKENADWHRQKELSNN